MATCNMWLADWTYLLWTPGKPFKRGLPEWGGGPYKVPLATIQAAALLGVVFGYLRMHGSLCFALHLPENLGSPHLNTFEQGQAGEGMSQITSV